LGFSPCHRTSHAKCPSAGNSKQFTHATTVEFCLSLSAKNAVKTQIWGAIAAYVLIAIIQKELQLDASPSPSLKKHRFHAPCSKLSQTPPALPR
jgi:hypothetical protein